VAITARCARCGEWEQGCKKSEAADRRHQHQNITSTCYGEEPTHTTRAHSHHESPLTSREPTLSPLNQSPLNQSPLIHSPSAQLVSPRTSHSLHPSLTTLTKCRRLLLQRAVVPKVLALPRWPRAADAVGTSPPEMLRQCGVPLLARYPSGRVRGVRASHEVRVCTQECERYARCFVPPVRCYVQRRGLLAVQCIHIGACFD
jgi:hypothetical protein